MCNTDTHVFLDAVQPTLYHLLALDHRAALLHQVLLELGVVSVQVVMHVGHLEDLERQGARALCIAIRCMDGGVLQILPLPFFLCVHVCTRV
jgi:hypothetical protein